MRELVTIYRLLRALTFVTLPDVAARCYALGEIYTNAHSAGNLTDWSWLGDTQATDGFTHFLEHRTKTPVRIRIHNALVRVPYDTFRLVAFATPGLSCWGYGAAFVLNRFFVLPGTMVKRNVFTIRAALLNRSRGSGRFPTQRAAFAIAAIWFRRTAFIRAGSGCAFLTVLSVTLIVIVETRALNASLTLTSAFTLIRLTGSVNATPALIGGEIALTLVVIAHTCHARFALTRAWGFDTHTK